MLKSYLLRFHRWLTLAFAAPLAVVIVTGLLLSLPPILQTVSIKPQSLTLEKVEALLAQYDPQGQARSLRLDTYQNLLTIGSIDVDLSTGMEANEEDWLSDILGPSRGIHQRLVFDLGWLVIASTGAMLVIMALGVLMGWPRFSNSASGWHKATAWVFLPLLILSPLTGLFIAGGLTFSAPAPRSQPVPILQAVRIIAASHDLSRLEWIRVRGGRQLARLDDGAGQRTFILSDKGLAPAPGNWPRTFHEGTFWGIWGGVMNLILSFAFVLLMGTGLWIWARRALRRRQKRVHAGAQ